jgi:hypothetical protein
MRDLTMVVSETQLKRKMKKILLTLMAAAGLATAAHAQYFNGYVSPPNGWAGSNWNGNISGYISPDYSNYGNQLLEQMNREEDQRRQQRAWESQQRALQEQNRILQNMQYNQQMAQWQQQQYYAWRMRQAYQVHAHHANKHRH